MFTGIVEQTGVISKVEQRGANLYCEIAHNLKDVHEGDSVAVDGVCLTALSPGPMSFGVDISFETLRLTTLGSLTQGKQVNLETALGFGDKVGGHMVTGHVDCRGKITGKAYVGECVQLTVQLSDPNLMQYCLHKGSISVNGVSLTINAVDAADSLIELVLIPHTVAITTFRGLECGDAVNIECDWTLRALFSREMPARMPFTNYRGLGVTIC